MREDMLDTSVFMAEDDYYLLFITEQHITCISLRDKYVIWELSTAKLQDVLRSQNGVTLLAIDGISVSLRIPELEDLDDVYEKLKGLRQMRSHLTH